MPAHTHLHFVYGGIAVFNNLERVGAPSHGSALCYNSAIVPDNFLPSETHGLELNDMSAEVDVDHNSQFTATIEGTSFVMRQLRLASQILMDERHLRKLLAS